jgi:hypothetical protein
MELVSEYLLDREIEEQLKRLSVIYKNSDFTIGRITGHVNNYEIRTIGIGKDLYTSPVTLRKYKILTSEENSQLNDLIETLEDLKDFTNEEGGY